MIKKLLSVFLSLALTALVILLMSIVIPIFMGFRPYVVISGSMTPKYPVGSIVFVKKDKPESVSVGDCISFRMGDMSVTHRVIAIDSINNLFYTKGDANTNSDSPVPFSSYIGTTSDYVILFAGYVSIFVKSHVVLTIVIFLSVALIILLGFILYRKGIICSKVRGFRKARKV